MHRDPESHKGDNGKVAIIGGSKHQHGAPLFSALACEASGVDLLYTFVPHSHTEVAKQASFNWQIHGFGLRDPVQLQSDELTKADSAVILELLATMDIAVIGPGLSRTAHNLSMAEEIITAAPCPLVVDASALQPWTVKAAAGKHHILTPHLGELERMGIKQSQLKNIAKECVLTFVLKSRVMTVFSSTGESMDVSGGNAGLTVGGTGDCLAGLIAGLVAQGLKAFDACVMASRIVKRAATVLFPEKGYEFTTREVIEQIPHLLHAYGTRVENPRPRV